LQFLKELVAQNVHPDPPKFGLDKTTMAFSDVSFHLCPGHAKTFQPSSELDQVGWFCLVGSLTSCAGFVSGEEDLSDPVLSIELNSQE
jgi:hypothetical protein